MENQMNHETEEQIDVVNAFLTLLQLFAGMMSGSAAMLSSALYCASNTFSVSGREPDEHLSEHRQRTEGLALAAMSALFGLMGVILIIINVIKLTGVQYEHHPVPGTLAVTVAVVSIIIKNVMYHRLRYEAYVNESSTIMADAWRQVSDSRFFIGVLIGILGSKIGISILDLVTSMIVCLILVKSSYDNFRDAFDKMEI